MRKTKLPIVTTFFVLVLIASAYSQSPVLTPKISISFKGIVLTDLLSYLHAAYGIDFSYGAAVPLDKKISIVAADLPLVIFLDKVCGKAGLAYQIIGNHVVLRPEAKSLPDTIVHRSASLAIPVCNVTTVLKEKTFVPVEKLRPVAPLFLPVKEGLPEVPTPEVIPMEKKDSVKGKYNREKDIFSIGLSASCDRFNYNFKVPLGADQEYRRGKSHSFGVSGIYWPGKVLGISLGVFLSKRNYYLDYNLKAINPKDPVAFPDKTKVCLSYLEFPAAVHIRFFKSRKISLSLSTRFIMAFLTGKEENTLLLNGAEEATAYLVGDNTRFLSGGSLGIRLWYSLYKSVKIYLEPEYAHYFNPVNRVIMDPGNPALKTNIGISLNI